MRKAVAVVAALAFVLAAGTVFAEEKKAPDTIVFEAKNGAVTFPHAKHVEAAKNDCKACHPGIFPEDRSPLNFKEGMHKKAETDKKSCGACHHPGGKSFESKGNCQKCHAKK